MTAAITAATEISRKFGLRPSAPVVLGGHSNTMVHLAPLPLVARVATGTGLVRSGPAWLTREVEVARYLAAVGAPVVRPSTLLDSGPHIHDGLTVSFWELVELRPEPIDPIEAGRSLRRCHEALGGFDGPLPQMGAIEEAVRLVDHPRVVAALCDEDRRVVCDAAARAIDAGEAFDAGQLRALHGDAHLHNLGRTATGPIWGDWEDTFAGPIEWDLACLVSSSIVLGDGSEAAALLQGYGGGVDTATLGRMIEARTLQAIVWAALLQDDADRNPRLRTRVAWLQRVLASPRK